jgi:hypothetical protein
MTKLTAGAIACAIVAGATVAYVRAEAEPSGYVGKGQLIVRTELGGTGSTITLGGDIAMEERGSRLRVDVLSLAIPGTSATISALIGTQLFPPGGFSVVYDRTNSSFTVWSNAQKKYYSTASAAATATPAPAPAPVVPVPGVNGDLFGAFAFAKRLKDYNALTLSLSLAGHQTVNGHPATGLDFHVLRTTKDNETTDVHGTVQFADDLDGVPVQIEVAGKGKSFPESAFRLDFSSLVKAAPPASDFDAPPGYARSASLGDVIGKSLPITGGS